MKAQFASKNDFNPDNWEFAGGIQHQNVSEDFQEYGEFIFEEMEAMFLQEQAANRSFKFFKIQEAKDLADPEGRYSLRGTCDHCGHAFNYGAVFKNKLDGKHLVLGNMCALNNCGLTGQQYTDKKMREIKKAAETKLANHLELERQRAANGGLTDAEVKQQKEEAEQIFTISHGRFPFGKHAGEAFEEAPRTYIDWIIKTEREKPTAVLTELVKALKPIFPEAFIDFPLPNGQCLKCEAGEKIEFEAFVSDKFSFEGHFGSTDVTKFILETGEILVHKGTRSFSCEVGEKVKIKATVKEFSEYNEIKQTMIIRPKRLA